jgi:hypothetical protein
MATYEITLDGVNPVLLPAAFRPGVDTLLIRAEIGNRATINPAAVRAIAEGIQFLRQCAPGTGGIQLVISQPLTASPYRTVGRPKPNRGPYASHEPWKRK